MYLPQILDPLEDIPQGPVFFGGINTYLQQNYKVFRKTPRWVDSIFDTGPFLRMAARKAGSVRANGLGEMTLSILKGAEGNQAKELNRLMTWIESRELPEVIHLSTPLLLGIGLEIKRRFGTKLACSLQDEGDWIDAMEEPFRTQCWETLAEMGREVDAFISVSRVFADIMQDRLKIEKDRLHVVHIGIDPGEEPGERPEGPPTIGYLARMSESLGLGLLATAFLQLRKSGRYPDLRLHVSGGSTADDAPFLTSLKDNIARAGLAAQVDFIDEFDPAARRKFLRSLTLLSVPAPNGVAFGTYILEAGAAGVPVVQPRLGSYVELVEATGGGILYEPNDPETLARNLGDLLEDSEKRKILGERGRRSVVESFSVSHMAGNMMNVYRGILTPRGAATPERA